VIARLPVRVEARRRVLAPYAVDLAGQVYRLDSTALRLPSALSVPRPVVPSGRGTGPNRPAGTTS